MERGEKFFFFELLNRIEKKGKENKKINYLFIYLNRKVKKNKINLI